MQIFEFLAAESISGFDSDFDDDDKNLDDFVVGRKLKLILGI